MNGSDRVFKRIHDGTKGKNLGISTGIPTLDKVVYGVQRASLITIFGDTGSGKSTLALYSYVYKPLMEMLKGDKKVEVLYLSFELPEDVLLVKLLSIYLWEEFGMVYSFKDILSLTDVLSEEDELNIIKGKAWLDTICEYLKIVEVPITPDACRMEIHNWCGKFGKYVEMEDKVAYASHDSELFKIVVIDHVKLTKSQGGTPKATIDAIAALFIEYKNLCKITGVFVQQANRNMKNMERRNGGFQMLQTDDLKDSSDTGDASEIIIGVFFPHREKLSKLEGNIDVKILQDKVRVLNILKNRFGTSDVNIPVNFMGEVGLFRPFQELPIVDYDKYLTLKVESEKTEPTDNFKEFRVRHERKADKPADITDIFAKTSNNFFKL